MPPPPAYKASCSSTSNARSNATADGQHAVITERMIEGFDLIPGTVVVADAGGAIVYVNPQGLKLSGYNASKIVGHPLTTFWDQPREASKEILSHLEEHRFWHGEIKQRGKQWSRSLADGLSL